MNTGGYSKGRTSYNHHDYVMEINQHEKKKKNCSPWREILLPLDDFDCNSKSHTNGQWLSTFPFMCHQCGEFPFALGQSKICVDLISIACSFTEMNTEIVDTYIVAPSLRRTPRVAAVTSILASIWGIANRGHGHFFVTRRMMSGRQYERCIVRCTKKHLTLRSVSDFFFQVLWANGPVFSRNSQKSWFVRPDVRIEKPFGVAVSSCSFSHVYSSFIIWEKW